MSEHEYGINGAECETSGDKSGSDRTCSLVCWTIAATILAFMCIEHLGVLAGFVIGRWIFVLAAPAALIGSLAVGYLLARHEGLDRKTRLFASLVSFTILAVSPIFAGALFDLSWDGLWYHQTAVYQMADGWNPLSDPMHEFTPHLQDWVRHYAKGTWYVALALYKTTGDIEWAKATTWLTLAVMFTSVFAGMLDAGLRRRTAIVVAVLVSVNPVIVFELASYLVDGIMIALLATVVAATVSWLRRPGLMNLSVSIMAAILCINAKFTGMVYLCFFIAAGGLYILIRQRERFRQYVAVQTAVILLGTLVFGFNPYVTNTIHRGNPFYPLLGSAAWPSHAAQDQDDIENVETPKNMMGRNRVVRLGYAVFGRPGASPYYPGENATLMWPFDVSLNDFAMYYFHDTRIAGFGPLFSGALLISLIVLGVALTRPRFPRLAVMLIWCAALVSLLVSRHTWWARFGPQLWWVPVIAVTAGLSAQGGKYLRVMAWGLAVLLFINALGVGAVHFKWEMDATRTTYEQMALLRDMGTVDVNLRYFGEPFGKRLAAHGVTFNNVGQRGLRGARTMELMSVSPGYPGAVLVRIPDSGTGR